MLYDQAIIVELPTRDGAKYIANLRYVIKDSVTSHEGLSTGDYDSFDSICSETMIGVKNTESKYTQCWFGKQSKALVDVVATENDMAAQFVLAQTTASSSTKMLVSDDATKLAQTKVRAGNNFGDMSEADRTLLAQTINQANLGWTASPYLA